jgi:hypothetical protein
MSIANPQTYAEWFYQQQVDANKTFADEEEETLAPLLQALFGMVSDLEGFPPEIAAIFGAVGTPGHFGLASVAKESLGNAGNASLGAGLSPFLRALGYAANKKFPSARIDFHTAVSLAHKGKIIPELFNSRALINGYEEAEARLLYEDATPYPDMISLMQWARYTTDAGDVFNKVQSKMDIPDDEFQIWDFLSQVRLSVSEIQQLYLRKYMGPQDARTELLRDGYRPVDADAVLDLAFTVPNPAILVQAGLLRDQPNADLLDSIVIGGIHRDYAGDFLDAILSKPNPTDLIRYSLRVDPNLSNIEEGLRRLGVHPAYIDVFKTLAYPVPPIGDMITMAVREAFSPDIAGRFGQYEDYPQDLTKYAAQNGISEEWARRYWAAHWALPSPQQGFEMFQRGIITQEELFLLMRALDIMPFWRNKLLQMSYRPLTRVDVRRMYALGVLSEGEVEKAYRDVGYEPENARRLKDFVTRDTIRSQSGMSVSKIVTAYKNGYTTRQDANNAILTLGIRPQNVSDILENADRQLQWQRTKDAIAAIRNQYKQELITPEQARSELNGLRLDTSKVNVLLAQWEADGVKDHKTLWTKADVVSMMKKGIITATRGAQELSLLGYNTERANALIALASHAEK